MKRFIPIPVVLLAAIAFALGMGNAAFGDRTRPAAEQPKPDPYPYSDVTYWRQGYLYEKRWRKSAIRQRNELRVQIRSLRERRARARRLAGAGDYWIRRQIWAATIIGRESAGDPWPNCPDPFDGSGASWTDTVNCENGGNWYDSPGFFRCGLQFHPAWERRFGRLCP